MSRSIYGVEIMHFSINSYAGDIIEANMINIDHCEKSASGLEQFAYKQRKATISGDSSMELIIQILIFNILQELNCNPR